MDSVVYSLKINNRPFNYLDGLTIFQACLDKRVYVPRFCYHVLLSIAGNCRMCLVEEKSSLKPVASCAVSIASGMTIYTDTELVKKAREGVLEYLLINHPLDCPICDQGGECDLQDQTMVFGADRGRFYENKRAVPNKNLGFLIKTFFNRCIHCARCTRFLNDVTGSAELQLLGRGETTEISPYVYKFVTTELSGNIIDLCPVGALTSKPYAFKARPWELAAVQTFDIVEPFGSNIELNYRGLELMRVLPKINGEINGEWISDKTRFFYDSLNIQRLTTPYLVKSGLYRNLSWVQTLYYIINKFSLDLESDEESAVGLCVGEYTDIRASLVFGSTLSRFSNMCGNGGLIDNSNRDFRVFYLSDFSSEAWGLFAGTEFEIEKVFILYTNPRFESPIVNVKLRQLAMTKNCVYVFGFISNLNYEFVHITGSGAIYHFEALLTKSPLINTLIVTRMNYAAYNNLDKAQIHRIAPNIGALSSAEVIPHKIGPIEKFNNIELFGGQPELPYVKKTFSALNIAFLHHVEDVYWENQSNWFGLKLPVKFYVEKISIYVSESAYFFNTVTNIFGVRILGSKDETQILNTTWGLLNSNYLETVERFFWNLTGRLQLLNFHGISGQKNSFSQIIKSTIHNYYDSGLLVRLSPTLSLCHKRYFIENDYAFTELLKYNAS